MLETSEKDTFFCSQVLYSQASALSLSLRNPLHYAEIYPTRKERRGRKKKEKNEKRKISSVCFSCLYGLFFLLRQIQMEHFVFPCLCLCDLSAVLLLCCQHSCSLHRSVTMREWV